MARGRLIREHELEDLLTLYQMLNPDDPDLEVDGELRTLWREMLDDESLKIVVVEHDDRLVASCVLSITPNLTRNARPFGLVENVVTHEAYRRNGFGRRCLETATEIAADHDCYKVMLLTGSDSEWKHDFYERCGFDGEAKTGFVLDLPVAASTSWSGTGETGCRCSPRRDWSRPRGQRHLDGRYGARSGYPRGVLV